MKLDRSAGVACKSASLAAIPSALHLPYMPYRFSAYSDGVYTLLFCNARFKWNQFVYHYRAVFMLPIESRIRLKGHSNTISVLLSHAGYNAFSSGKPILCKDLSVFPARCFNMSSSGQAEPQHPHMAFLPSKIQGSVISSRKGFCPAQMSCMASSICFLHLIISPRNLSVR